MGIASLHERKLADIAACDPPLDGCYTAALSQMLSISV